MKLDFDYFRNNKYVQNAMQPSPFDGTEMAAWAGISGKSKGTVAEKVLIDYLNDTKFTARKLKAGADIEVTDNLNRKKNIELKFSTLNRNDGYIWNQIRTDEDFDYIVFMALDPTELHVWYTDKETILEYTEEMEQHAKGVAWIAHRKDDIPYVFNEFSTTKLFEPITPTPNRIR